jgi:hypothetical protein
MIAMKVGKGIISTGKIFFTSFAKNSQERIVENDLHSLKKVERIGKLHKCVFGIFCVPLISSGNEQRIDQY